MNYIIKQKVFGILRCWMYSVEWQNRGLPHVDFERSISTDQIILT